MKLKLCKRKIAAVLIAVMAYSAPLTAFATTSAVEDDYIPDEDAGYQEYEDDDDVSVTVSRSGVLLRLGGRSITNTASGSNSTASGSNTGTSTPSDTGTSTPSDTGTSTPSDTDTGDAGTSTPSDTDTGDAGTSTPSDTDTGDTGTSTPSDTDTDDNTDTSGGGTDDTGTTPSTPDTSDDSGSGTSTDSVDKSSLEAAIESAEGLTSSRYTSTTWSALQTALANAKAVLADENATQEEVDEATDALLAAISALRRKSSGGGSGGSSSSGSSSSGSSSSGSWRQDAIGWWYQYTDGSYAKDAWAKINGLWYYFNGEGYACQGWQLIGGLWYYLDPANNHMLTGWHEDPQDGYWYYLDQSSGKMLTGWQLISGLYYYFNAIDPDQPTWTYDADNGAWNHTNDAHRPYGSMYVNEITPDGYQVDTNGAWIQ